MKRKNPKIASGAMAHLFMKNKVLVCVIGQKYVELYDRKLKKIVPATLFMANSFSDGKFSWGIHSYVTGRNQLGEEYFKGGEIFTEICKQSDIAAFANKEHMAIVNGFNPEQMLAPAWIACPFGSDIPGDEASEILTNCGAYEYLAKWEADRDGI